MERTQNKPLAPNRAGGVCGGMATPSHRIRLTGNRWRILIEGDNRCLALFPNRRNGFEYHIKRLFEGESVSLRELEYYGVQVRHLGDEVEIIEVPGE